MCPEKASLVSSQCLVESVWIPQRHGDQANPRAEKTNTNKTVFKRDWKVYLPELITVLEG